ncbi:putative lipase [Aaosphaeria arxii CBS 175.79]|uniref:Carboxylic ester hydrolase n=1 Tax=Aaosphaeria arxii CBS 175.79 TaxID=1450172 RepID=A0A6A5XQM8_9PLEO|nr:putative lipase [Aaosphaeria arxii CBS 175.79]KAF2015243.1 putative lipase [Aaosphaeria arxii CBS 175.79]
MKQQIALVAAFLLGSFADQNSNNIAAVDHSGDIKYLGIERNGVEVFLNIPYGQDTGGENRFKPPRPFVPEPGSIFNATAAGPACPQSLGQWFPPVTLNNITEISENCLSLNIARPKPSDRNGCKPLPVMVWIHGGSFWVGSNTEPTHQPDGLILQSVQAKNPVIHVAINYRLGFFGFAKSDALQDEGSTNAGLRDQRLAIEWVRENIAHFGGDPENITIFGQSSGGLAVGMQLLAYGGTKPLPFRRGICQSQALEPGITGNFTSDAMANLVEYIGCGNKSTVNSALTISCLRGLDTQTLFNASFDTYVGDIAHNIGDVWLPTVDGDFIPDTPSKLIKEGRFGQTYSGENVTYMFGWADGDVNFYTDYAIATANDTENFISTYISNVPEEDLSTLYDLYPVSEFEPPTGTNLTAEFYRSARIFRDILMVCEPLFLAEHFVKFGGEAYMYDFNQTVLESVVEATYNISKIGVIHTSEFAYIYGNLSHYEGAVTTESDELLLQRASRSWSGFANGDPSEGFGALQGWQQAFDTEGNVNIFVVGGENEGLTSIDGPKSTDAMKAQKLRERCGLINSDDWIKWLQY